MCDWHSSYSDRLQGPLCQSSGSLVDNLGNYVPVPALSLAMIGAILFSAEVEDTSPQDTLTQA